MYKLNLLLEKAKDNLQTPVYICNMIPYSSYK